MTVRSPSGNRGRRSRNFASLMRMVNRGARSAADTLLPSSHPVRRALSPAYSACLNILSGGRGYPAEINGQVFWIDPRYRWSVWHEHERGVAAFLRSRIRPGQTCFDVGANVGIYAVQMCRWSAPGGRVVAFEPNAATLRVLRKHMRLNGLEDRVTIVPSAVGARTGRAALYDSQPGSGLSRLGGPRPGVEQPMTPADVPLTTIDEYCRTSGVRPDWMLIDVEGYEYEVLLGAKDTLARQRPGVVIELHQHVCSDESRIAGERLIGDLGLTTVPIPGAAQGRSERFVSLEARRPSGTAAQAL